ncbi:MAG: efflux RND transporter periplasmic adaptor subunit [bacterium]
MKMKMPSSVISALLIVVFITIYFVVSALFRGKEEAAGALEEKPPFIVQIQHIEPQSASTSVIVNGNVEAGRSVIIRAETMGQVIATPSREGTAIRKGAALCRLATDNRKAMVDEANAAVQKAQIDYQAIKKLHAEGFAAPASLAAAKAGLDQAQAGLKRAQEELANAIIKAPFTGTLDQLSVEIGDFLSIGMPCAVVTDLEGIRFTGSVSQKDISLISLGDPVQVSFGTAAPVNAKVSYISATASPVTRAFTIEAEMANPGNILSGQTAQAVITTGSKELWNIPRNAIVNNDKGEVGVRIVTNISNENKTGTVQFVPIEDMKDSDNGFWVSGFDGAANVITRGQNYVENGNSVRINLAE